MKLFIFIIIALSAFVGCGKKKNPFAKNKSEDSAEVVTADPHKSVAPVQPTPTATPEDTSKKCLKAKSNAEWMTQVTQDLFRRPPENEEIKKANDPKFDRAKFMDEAFLGPDYDTGIAKFVSDLFRLEQNLTQDPASANVAEAALLNDLKQEPVIFVQKNKDKPWPWFFRADEIYCTALTAPIYSYPVDKNIKGFVRCKLPKNRAGFLGMASFLRSFPSAFYLINSNRHRVAAALYLIEGIQLQAATNGPAGSGPAMPVAACVPLLDNRTSNTGQLFGTAAVLKAGSTCTGCHAPKLAPLESAFYDFEKDGTDLQVSKLNQVPSDDRGGVSVDALKEIFLSEYARQSCYSIDGPGNYPQNFEGVVGLGRLLQNSKLLGRALAIQIQQNLVNKAPVDTTTDAIVKAYEANGKTLQAALKGYFLSEDYQCLIRE